jgi:hypothetical protein
MIDELESSGVIGRVYDSFSGMVQHKIEEVYRNRSNPERLELELTREKIRELEEKKERLAEEVDEADEDVESGEIEEFFDEFIQKIIDRKGRKSFQEKYEEWEEGNKKRFSKKHFSISKKRFREKAQKAAEEKDYELQF